MKRNQEERCLTVPPLSEMHQPPIRRSEDQVAEVSTETEHLSEFGTLRRDSPKSLPNIWYGDGFVASAQGREVPHLWLSQNP